MSSAEDVLAKFGKKRLGMMKGTLEKILSKEGIKCEELKESDLIQLYRLQNFITDCVNTLPEEVSADS